jgi:hypothetical protein
MRVDEFPRFPDFHRLGTIRVLQGDLRELICARRHHYHA